MFETLSKGTSTINTKSIFDPDGLIADAATTIQNAFHQVSGENKEIVMCWVHMNRNVEKKLELENAQLLINHKNGFSFNKGNKLVLLLTLVE